jgi:hemerythrin-like domain-containing protein
MAIFVSLVSGSVLRKALSLIMYSTEQSPFCHTNIVVLTNKLRGSQVLNRASAFFSHRRPTSRPFGKLEKIMNAMDLLKADHEVVEGLFREVEATDRGGHADLFVQIKTELEAHAHIEETHFYPAIQEDGSDELVELVSDALKEHEQAKAFLGELSVAAVNSDGFEGLLAKLIEDVRHHVQEEENEMFPLVESEFDEGSLDELGVQMQDEKDRFNSSGESVHA